MSILEISDFFTKEKKTGLVLRMLGKIPETYELVKKFFGGFRMKKLLAVFAVLAFSVTAHATDRTGAFALGYQASFNNGNVGAWSVKYGLSANTTVQGLVGFNIVKGGSNETASFGARVLYDLAEAENSDFYTGLGVAYSYFGNAAVGGPDDVLSVSIPLGFEFSLANVPNVAFSGEMGLQYNKQTQGAKAWNIGSVGGGTGAVFTAGAHYYF